MPKISDKLKILLAYDGKEFRGFAPNPGVPTVAGALTDALAKILDSELSLVCAGRTDAGVHAWGQVVSVSLAQPTKQAQPKKGTDLDRLKSSLNSLCGPAISIRQVEWVASSFDARNSAKSRLYFYHISNSVDMNPHIRDFSWHIPEPLDLKAMARGARQLKGEQDFSAFCRKPTGDKSKSLSRFVMRAGWQKPNKEDPSFLRFYIEANAFCHQMVRSIVGTLVEIGNGRLDPQSIPQIIASKDRSAAGQLAPAHGLVLEEVFYPSK